MPISRDLLGIWFIWTHDIGSPFFFALHVSNIVHWYFSKCHNSWVEDKPKTVTPFSSCFTELFFRESWGETQLWFYFFCNVQLCCLRRSKSSFVFLCLYSLDTPRTIFLVISYLLSKINYLQNYEIRKIEFVHAADGLNIRLKR